MSREVQGTGRPSVAQLHAPDIFAAAALLCILGLAVWLRWNRLDYVEFGRDQAWAIDGAYRWIFEGKFPLHGLVASVGALNGPMEVYLLGLPVALSTDPRVATAFVGLLQTLAILATYLLCSRYFGRVAGLIAALLYATNPWALQYARKIWTPDMLPLFTVLFFSALFAVVVDRRRYQITFACLWLAVLLLIHISSIGYALLLALVVVVFWSRLGPGALLLGVELGLVLAAPFLYFEAERGFDSIGVYLGVGTAAASHVDLESLKHVLALGSAQYFPMMMGYGFRGDWALPEVHLQNDLSVWLISAGLAICVGRLGVWLWRRRPATYDWEKYALLLLWFVVPVFVSLRHPLEVYPHYYIAAYPVQFVLIGLALATPISALGRIDRHWRRYVQLGAGGLAAAVALYIAVPYAGYFQAYLNCVVTSGPLGPYGVPLLFAERAVEGVREAQAEFPNSRTYVYSYDQIETLDYLARPDVRLRHVEPPDTIVLPKDPQTSVLAVLSSDDAYTHLVYDLVRESSPRLARLRALGFEEVPNSAVLGPDGHYYYRFFRLAAGKAGEIISTFTPTEQYVHLANGMALRGYKYSTSREGATVRLDLLWDLPDSPQGQSGADEYNLFAHLVDAVGRELGASEREVHRSLGWRSDEVAISTFEIEVKPEVGPALIWFDLGAYSRYDRAGVSWQDARGRDLGSAFKLGPFKIAPPRPSQPPAVTTDFRFGEGLALIGFGLDPARPIPGGNLTIALRWRALAKPAADYVVSVQLLDAAGQLVAQHDSPPVGGNYPTSHWAAGEEVTDNHMLAIPKDAPAGNYRLIAVVYTLAGQKRLPVAGAGDHAPLAQLIVGDAL